MIESLPPTLVRLRKWLAEQDEPALVMEELGLFLSDELQHGGYWCTPTNSVMFAATGGDGVHFSLVDLGDGIGESSPVVMTVPMSSVPNWFLGENLLDFLSLGLRSGYFVLEQLSYGVDWSTDIEDTADSSLSRALIDLGDRLGLRPWTNVNERLKLLDERFGSKLIVADLPTDAES